MKLSWRWFGVASLLSCAAVAQGCAESHHSRAVVDEAEVEVGGLRLSLEATSDRGRRFRLRQAVFLVDRGTNSFQDIFGGDIDVLLELLGQGFDINDLIEPDFFERELAIDSEDDVLAPELRKEVPAGSYRVFLREGWFLERVDGRETEEVSASLVGSATQFMSVSSGQDTIVEYTFETDGETVSFSPRGGVVIRPTIVEVAPDAGLDGGGDGGSDGGGEPRGSVIELDQRALASINLPDALAAIGENAGLSADPELLYHSMIDSYASAGRGQLPEAVHCGDEMTEGEPTLNGFPIVCDRLEAQQFDNLEQWFPTAVVNRLDLAPLDGTHCGQQRIIFANNARIGNGRMFVILEAQIPNPEPGCGVEACRPLAEAWSELAGQDPRSRGQRLRDMFMGGDEELARAGFGPFLSADNMTVGTGQIRTNNFNSSPWTLREFKVVMREGVEGAMAVPFPVAEAPHGRLWNDNLVNPVAEDCRDNFLEAIDGVLTDNLARMSFVVDDACKDAESPNDFFTQDYASHLRAGSNRFFSQIEERLEGTGLDPIDIANRARFSGSCMGCHQEASGLLLGNGVMAPFSDDFVQVQEVTGACEDGSPSCFVPSRLLIQEFLPHREQVQASLLARPACVGVGIPPVPADAGFGFPSFPSSDGGVTFGDAGFEVPDGPVFADAGIDFPLPDFGAAPGSGGFSGTAGGGGPAGGFGAAGDDAGDPAQPFFGDSEEFADFADDADEAQAGTTGSTTVTVDAPDAETVSVIPVGRVAELSEEATLEELVQAEAALRDALTGLTLGGQPAGTTH